MKKFLFLAIPLFLLAVYLHTHSKRSDFFCPAFITYEPALWPKCEAPALESHQKLLLAEIFAQPFKYLGSGNQTFAFESADGRYVLKFFKFQHLRENAFSLKSAESKARRLQQVFSGHSIAYTLDRGACQIVYAHLSPEPLHLSATVSDMTGVQHLISLDEVVFVVQLKGADTRSIIGALLKQGKIETAKQYIHNLLTLYVEDYKRGIFDRDHNVMCNTGFVNGIPFRIDAGKLRLDEKMKNPEIFRTDLEKIAWQRIDKWMKRHYPEHRREMAEELTAFLEQKF